MVTSSDDGTVKLWDLKTGEFVRNLVELPSGGSGECVWDGERIGGGCMDVWNLVEITSGVSGVR